jgi:hypothetical protein
MPSDGGSSAFSFPSFSVRFFFFFCKPATSNIQRQSKSGAGNKNVFRFDATDPT